MPVRGIALWPAFCPSISQRAQGGQTQREITPTTFSSSFSLVTPPVLIKREVVPIGSQPTTQTETPSPSAAETADPLFYPSWYKGQNRKTISNPPCTPGSEGLGPIGPPGAEDSSTQSQSAGVAGAAANEQAAVSGKESSSPAATSQVSVEALLSECFPTPATILLEKAQSESRAF